MKHKLTTDLIIELLDLLDAEELESIKQNIEEKIILRGNGGGSHPTPPGGH